MRAKVAPPTFSTVSAKLTAMGFALTPQSGGQVLARKNGCAAMLAPTAGGKAAEVAAAPGRVVGGELARLVDRGYQKFFKTADREIPALPEDMLALAQFENELRYACGVPSLYNEGLGSVSDRYLYDRIAGRE